MASKVDYQRFYMNRQGYTLIEVMIVVVLMGVLASLAIVRYSQATARAKMVEAVSMLKSMWEMEYTYYVATGEPISADGFMVYYGVEAGDSDIEKENRRRLLQMGLDEPSGGGRFYYVTTEGAVTFAFPKTSDSPFDFPASEIDGSLKNIEVAIDNDGRVYVYEDGNVREFN